MSLDQVRKESSRRITSQEEEQVRKRGFGPPGHKTKKGGATPAGGVFFLMGVF
jgi:hypothetical protein